MDEEKIVTGYDSQLTRRLISYLKPYRIVTAVAVLALVVSTTTELLVPVVIQRTIDRDITVDYYRIPLASRSDPLLSDLELSGDEPVVGDSLYVRTETVERLGEHTLEGLIEEGTVHPEEWYVFPIDEDEDLRYLLQLKSGLFEADGAYGSIRIIDLEHLSSAERRTMRKNDIAGIIDSTLMLLGLLLAGLIFTFLQVYVMTYVGQGVMKNLRMQIFRHTLRQSPAYLQRNPIGRLVTRSTNDVESINELFTNVATSLLKDVSLIVGVLVTIFLLDTRLAIVALLTMPPIIIATLFFRVKARNAYRRVRLWVSRVNAFLSERLAGMHLVQLFAREARSMKEFTGKSRELLKANISEMFVFAFFRPLVDLFTSVSIGAVIYAGANLETRNVVSLGVLIAFINLVGKFYRPIQDISEKFTILQSAMAGSERVFELLDTDETIPDKGTKSILDGRRGRAAGEKPFGRPGTDGGGESGRAAGEHAGGPRTDGGGVRREPKGAVRFEKVRFGYHRNEPVIEDLSFEIKSGERVAIVGYTGAGKTTVANLLARFWDIWSGSIRIDDVDIREIPLAELRTIVQPVHQDVFLFSGSILDNIRLGRVIPEEKILEAAKAVNAHRFIERLSHGYETLVQESGANLSSGQRQLISFARAIAGGPRIIVLDEATSSVDTETEKLIQQGIAALLEGRTSLTIAHRLSTIRDADRILVMNRGRLVESGSHEELMAHDGMYAMLYRLQYVGMDDAGKGDGGDSGRSGANDRE